MSADCSHQVVEKSMSFWRSGFGERQAARLWQSDEWTPEAEDRIAASLLPDSRLHIGLAASRIARPDYPAVCTQSTGIEELTVVGTEGTSGTEWIRLGVFEAGLRFYHTHNSRREPGRAAGHRHQAFILAAIAGAHAPHGLPGPEKRPFGKGQRRVEAKVKLAFGLCSLCDR
jgi:hypothetical protein